MKWESFFEKIFVPILRIVAVLLVVYYITTEYLLYWYLRDHYQTTTGTVVGIGTFENGGYTYDYQFEVDGKLYVRSSLASSLIKPPAIGEKYLVKYLSWWPNVATPDFDIGPLSPEH